MTQLCDYGCGKVAIYFHLPSYKVPTGRYMCATHANSCPTKRAKTIGEKNPSKRPEIRQKIKEINSVLFASGSVYREHQRQQMLKKYGVDNIFKVPEVARNTAIKRKQNKSYRYQPAMNGPEANKKRKETRIAKGLELPDEHKTPFEIYERTVDNLTKISYHQHQHQINPNNLKRGRRVGEHQLDHILSKTDGFKQDIPPEIIAHPANLRMLTSTENKTKHHHSHLTKTELLEAINAFDLTKTLAP